MSIDNVNANKINEQINITHEMNLLDKIISTDCATTNKLLNDFHANETKKIPRWNPHLLRLQP